MDIVFSKDSEAKLVGLLESYPTAEACLLPALHLAQEQFGTLTHEVMQMVAARLRLPPERVLSTATFYTMFRKQPAGRHLIQVCANVSCFLNGSDAVLAALQDELGIAPGQTTADHAFTLITVQCLAACGNAPALQVNDTYYENMTPDKARQLVRRLRQEGRA